MYRFICENCGKKFERKVNKNQRFCSNKCRAQHIMPFKNPSYIPYNYDFTKIRFCKDCGNKLGNGNKSGYCHKCYSNHNNRREILSQIAKENHYGGYNFGSGGGHKGKYDGINFDSSWELAFYIYHKEHNLNVKRCNEIRTYINSEGIKRNYIPDFITDDGIIEIKGYITENSILKSIYNPDIKVLYYEDIKPYLDYVIEKYGKDFIKLYNAGVAQ